MEGLPCEVRMKVLRMTSDDNQLHPQTIEALRLVCKAWNRAILLDLLQSNRTHARLYITESNDVKTWRGLFPEISSLSVSSR